MNRRHFLRAGGGLAIAGSAGCLSRLGFETRSVRSPPLVENRPNAVYVPTHEDGMEMAGTTRTGPYMCSLSYSYPHRFWLVTGTERRRVEVESGDSVHLMVRLWDAETGVVPPNGSVTMEIRRDGERVTERPPWSMLSQNMGFHFGDNVSLPGDGSYDVTVRVGPMQTRRTGAFEGRFEERAEASFSFEFSQQALEDVPYQLLEERQGRRGALEPMQMGGMDTGGMDGGEGSMGGTPGEDEGSGAGGGGTMQMGSVPMGQLPAPGDLPGRTLGEATMGDGTFVVKALDEPPAGLEGTGGYLAVSARTPYNRYPLPFMSVTASLARGGETAFDGPLAGTLDPDLRFHYGAVVDSVEPGDVLELDVGAPPQVARHEGYETAFLQMEPTSLTLR